MVSRRRFLLVGLGVGSAVGAVVTPAGASTTTTGTVTLWRLSSDWGYPAGPKGRTRCKGRACHLHAANKIYESESAAIAGRLHLCCVAQPTSFEIPIEVHREITAVTPTRPARPNPGPELTDLRYEGIAEAWARAALGAQQLADQPTRRSTAPPAQLASTGGSVATLAAGGLALGAIGATAMVISRRNTDTADTAETAATTP